MKPIQFFCYFVAYVIGKQFKISLFSVLSELEILFYYSFYKEE